MSGVTDLGSRLLRAAIDHYRRGWSGRGPFRRCRCTFERLESCSVYGARIARERPAGEAIRLIARRLRRCRDLSVYAFPGEASPAGAGWGRDFDDVERASDPRAALLALDAELAGDGESPAARGAVVRAAARIATGAAPHRGPGELLVRDGWRVAETLERRRDIRRGAAILIAIAAATTVLALDAPLIGASGALTALGAIALARRNGLAAARVVRQGVLAGLELEVEPPITHPNESAPS